MRRVLVFSLLCVATQVFLPQSRGGIVIGGYMANPAGTDSPNEYVQLVATDDINFAATNWSVVFNNNGTASPNGWIAGGATSYGFNLTTGTISRGDTFYVGGSGQVVNGSGSASIASLNFVRSINTATTAGDGFGTANTSGVLGNGGGNADGIGVFMGSTTTLTAATTPMDAVFFGTGVGNTRTPTAGYLVPANDRFAGGFFGDPGNASLFADPTSGTFTQLSGTFDTSTNMWTTARTATLLTPTTPGDLATGITLQASAVPEPTSFAAIAGATGLFGLIRQRRKSRCDSESLV